MSDKEWANESLRVALQNIQDAATKPLHVEIESLRSRLAEETAIVDRIWDIYGRPTYEQLAGRSIYDLINADLARLAEVERLLQEVYDGRQALMSVGLVYRIGHTLNHRPADSTSAEAGAGDR